MWYFLFFYRFSDWIRKVIQQCGIFCVSTFFLIGLGRCSNSEVFFVFLHFVRLDKEGDPTVWYFLCFSTGFLIGLGR